MHAVGTPRLSLSVPLRSTCPSFGLSSRSYEGNGPFCGLLWRKGGGVGERREQVCLGGVSLLFQVCTEEEQSGSGRVVFGCVGMSLLRRYISLPCTIFFSVFFNILVFVSIPHLHHVLAEVVVCAVGWVVTLPAMEMTAQATALLVLVPPLQPRKKPCSQRR